MKKIIRSCLLNEDKTKIKNCVSAQAAADHVEPKQGAHSSQLIEANWVSPEATTQQGEDPA